MANLYKKNDLGIVMDQYKGIPSPLVRVYSGPIVSLQLLTRGGAISTVVTSEIEPGNYSIEIPTITIGA